MMSSTHSHGKILPKKDCLLPREILLGTFLRETSPYVNFGTEHHCANNSFCHAGGLACQVFYGYPNRWLMALPSISERRLEAAWMPRRRCNQIDRARRRRIPSIERPTSPFEYPLAG
jgi:hypothetical protein